MKTTGREKTLLIVDDNTHEAFSIAGVLQGPSRKESMALRVFTDGDEALACIVEDKTVDIGGAIVDLWMVDKHTGIENPNKGNELIRALREHHPDARVVVLSAHMDERAREEFKVMNMPSFKKPASVVEVFEAVVRRNETRS